MSDNPVFDRISSEIAETPVVLFMKGTPAFPQCGFSAAVVQGLSQLGVEFKGVDVLADPSLRQGIRILPTGRRSPSFTSKAISSAAQISSAR